MRRRASTFACALLLFAAEGIAQESREEFPRLDFAGRVLMPDGTPGVEARIAKFWSFEDGASSPDETLTSDTNGVFSGKMTVWSDLLAVVAYSKDGRLAGFTEVKKEGLSRVVVRLSPTVRVRAKVTSDAEGKKPIWFNSYWNVCHQGAAQHLLDLVRADPNEKALLAMAESKTGILDVALPPGTYDYDVYDSDFTSKRGHLVVPADKPEVDLGLIVLPQSFFASHAGKELPEWKVAAARGVDADKTRIADFRGKWLLVEFWGFW